MAHKSSKKIRNVALGYVIFSLMFFGIGSIIMFSMEWKNFTDFTESLAIISNILFVLFLCTILNLLMAYGAWNILSYEGIKKKVVLYSSIGIALLLTINNLIGFISWLSSSIIQERDHIQKLLPLFINLSYIFLAVQLYKAVIDFQRQAPKSQ